MQDGTITTVYTSGGEPIDLYHCPACGFTFDAIHLPTEAERNEKGWVNCPCCHESEALEAGAVAELREALEALLAEGPKRVHRDMAEVVDPRTWAATVYRAKAALARVRGQGANDV